MAELRPVAEVVEDIVRAQGMAPKIAVLPAGRIVVATRGARAYKAMAQNGVVEWQHEIFDAIRAVAQPPETERERLAEALWRFECGDAGGDDEWGENAESFKEAYRKGIAVTLAELEKIRAAQDA